MLDLIYTYDENSNRDSVEYNHLTTSVWDIYTYDNLQRLTEAEYGSLTGLARLDDFVGDVRFAAGVASKWLTSDEPFMELARLQVRDIRRRREEGIFNHEVMKEHEDIYNKNSFPSWSFVPFMVDKAFIEAGLDEVVKNYNNGEMPLVRFVEFGEDETPGANDKSTYEMIRNDSGELIGIVVTDSKGRITLFVLYPEIGGTIVISIGYDNKGNVTSKILTSYDDDGNVVARAG